MTNHQRAASVFWFFVGVATLINAYFLGLGHWHRPGPGFIFFLAALVLTALSILDLANNFFWKTRGNSEEKEERIWANVRWIKILLVLAALVGYAYFLNFLGFPLATFLLMVFLFKAVEPTKWPVAIASSLITIFCCYFLFQVWLKVPLPSGFWGF